MPERYDPLRRQIKDATSQPLTDNQALTSGEAQSVIELADVTRRLAYLEQMQLVRLNAPIEASKLAFSFIPEDIRRADPAECDVLVGTEKIIEIPGSDHAMALINSTRGVSAEGKILEGKFDSIFMTKEAYEARGAKVIVLTDANSDVPQGELQGRIQIPDDMLSEINSQLKDLNRVTLPETLKASEQKSGADGVKGFEIVPEKAAGNDFFYKRGHIGLVLKLDSGKSILMTHNALNEKGEQGSVNLVRFNDGKYGMVNTVRMLVGAGSIYRPEIGRGYADVMVDRYAKQIKEKYGVVMSPDQVQMELGLVAEEALHVETHQLRQDVSYENVTPKLQILEFDKDVVMKTAPDHIQHMLEEFEGLTPIRRTPEQILKDIDDGTIVDGFTIGVMGSEFLNKGIVKLNPKYADDCVALEMRSIPQLGGKVDFVVPQGPAYEPGMHTVGQVHPNTGNARFWYQVRITADPKVLDQNAFYVRMPVTEVLERIKDLKFSTVDAAVLFRALYNQRVLIPSAQ